MVRHEPARLPLRGVLVGLDFGTRRVGVAVSDSGQSIASPLRVLPRDGSFHQHLARVVSEYEGVGLVVGLPVHMSGDEGEKAGQAREFGEAAAAALGLPVAFHDERFTSKQAEAALRSAGLSREKRKARIDMLAAQFMLQAYLDSDRTQQPPVSMT